MEALTRLVTDSLARHGFDRPLDPRRLQWSRWFRCDSPHSLLIVPSKPGIFAIAEEIMDFGVPSTAHVGTAAPGGPAGQSPAAASISLTAGPFTDREGISPLSGAMLQRCGSDSGKNAALAAGGAGSTHTTENVRRMLAVLQFCEDDDMAFVLDRMFTRINPMRARLATGRCFLRFVVIEDQEQRRTICSALNQWMLSSAEKASGIPAGFSSSMEISSSEEQGIVGAAQPKIGSDAARSAPFLDSGANKNLHCSQPLPSGF